MIWASFSPMKEPTVPPGFLEDLYGFDVVTDTPRHHRGIDGTRGEFGDVDRGAHGRHA